MMDMSPPPVPHPPAGGTHCHPFAFGGSGSEYFRIWIVNLLLMLVTLTLYYPWARVRKLRYFHRNTQVVGHAFDFHGTPGSMLRGYLLVAVLFCAYALAGEASPVAGVAAAVLLAAVWPALACASMRFRLAQTSWRGQRLGFGGTMLGAYRALLPTGVMLLLFVAAGAWDASRAEPRDPSGSPASAGVGVALIAALVLSLALAPVALWSWKRYLHDHLSFAGERTIFRVPLRAFFRLLGEVCGVALAIAAVLGLLVGAAAAGGASSGLSAAETRSVLVVAFSLAALAFYLAAAVVMQPFWASRLQNLAWNGTASPHLRFDSRLRFGPLCRLTLKNWLLVLLTLGLYWPFAAVATARLKIEAMTLLADVDLDTLTATQRYATRDASGDAAADVFGIDIGL